MKLPTSHGEKWTLIEAEPTGYLLIEKLRPSDSHAWIIFSKSPDLETISKSLVSYSDSDKEKINYEIIQENKPDRNK